MFFKKRFKKNFIKIYETPETGEKFGLISINGNMKNKLLEKFNSNYAIQGDHLQNGGKISNDPMLALLAGGTGALGISGMASGSLFMATANPATLMAIGSGVGSAVMGVGGIVAQAPFIPVAGALMPVIAPLLAFQVLTTIIILNQFKAINKKLASIEKSINRVLQRQEATLIGEIISACSRLEILENEYNICNRFNTDMNVRLALLENKINPIFERYKYLYESQNIDNNLKSEDLKYKQTDAYVSIALSILDIRTDVLRLKLTVQENPGFMKEFAETLISKVKRYQNLWADIEKSPQRVELVSNDLKDTIEEMNFWERNMPGWLGGDRTQRKELEIQVESLERTNTVTESIDLVNAATTANNIGKEILKVNEPISLLYWEDELGKHSYYTSDLLIEPSN